MLFSLEKMAGNGLDRSAARQALQQMPLPALHREEIPAQYDELYFARLSFRSFMIAVGS
jgi:hypothetical protein